jgi:DNA-binding GntR family transcriptional regulator
MDPPLRPVERQLKSATHVYRELRRAILQGVLPGGTRLIELDLAQQLAVSRTPIREAVHRLEAEGLVQRTELGRAVVADTNSDLSEIFGMRARIEGYAARLGADRATEEEIRQLEESCRRGYDAINSTSVDTRSRLVDEFHRLLVETAHSPRLVTLAAEYRDYFLSHEAMLFYDQEETVKKHLDQQMDVVSALKDRDGVRAEAAAAHHLESVSDAVQKAIKQARGSARRLRVR